MRITDLSRFLDAVSNFSAFISFVEAALPQKLKDNADTRNAVRRKTMSRCKKFIVSNTPYKGNHNFASKKILVIRCFVTGPVNENQVSTTFFFIDLQFRTGSMNESRQAAVQKMAAAVKS